MVSNPVLLFLLFAAIFCSAVDARLRFSRNIKDSPSIESVADSSASAVPDQETKPYWDVGNERVLSDRYFGHKDGGHKNSYNYGHARSNTGKRLFQGYGW
jgi:hypothetical protein